MSETQWWTCLACRLDPPKHGRCWGHWADLSVSPPVEWSCDCSCRVEATWGGLAAETASDGRDGEPGASGHPGPVSGV